ncbi:MAG: ATP-binding protein [Verrucomicrobiales bacterium]|nr:ATP-binding protein [Verrucomicrobiales bacterium]
MLSFQKKYKVPAAKEKIFPLIDELCDFIGAKAVSSDAVGALRLALEELLMNICQHSGLGGQDLIDVEVEGGSGLLSLRLCDAGMAFDPLAVAEPDTSLASEDRAIGGLGIMLVRKMSDGFFYQRQDQKNVVAVTWGDC